MRCEELMKTNPTCLKEQDTAQHAASRMKEENIGFLPVCDNAGKPIGAVTDRDLAIRVIASNRNGSTKVTEFMTREVVCCKSSEDLSAAHKLMAKHHKSRMMVIDDGGKLLGVISLSDIAQRDTQNAAKTMRDVSEREARA